MLRPECIGGGGVSWHIVSAWLATGAARTEPGTTARPLATTLAIGVLLVGLGAAAAYNVWLAAQLIGRPDETRYGEAILYDHAARLLRGEALYQPLDGPPYTIVTYTPLYYWVVAGLRALAGPGLLSGRLVSLASGLATAAMVGWLVWRRTRAWAATLAAGLLFIGLGLGGLVPWTAAYKEDLLGVALGVASVLALEHSGGTPGRLPRAAVLGAAVLAAAAALTKQSLVGPAIAGAAWLVVIGRLRLALLFTLVVLALGLATVTLLELSSHAFFENTVGGNLHQPFDPLTFGLNLRELATYQSAPALLALAALVAERRYDKGLVVLSWFGSLLPLLFLGVIGADSNYWLHFAALSAVLATVWLWRARGRWWGVLGALLLVGNAAVALSGAQGWLRARPAFVAGGPAVEQPLRQLVERVAATPGTVLADPLDVLVLANRPILLEPIVYSLREQDGSWDARPMLARLCSGEVQLIVLGYPPQEMGLRFPRAVAAAVARAFVVVEEVRVGGGERWLLAPRRELDGCYT
jgi:hypothetical protein